jgi:hypothetical protein
MPTKQVIFLYVLYHTEILGVDMLTSAFTLTFLREKNCNIVIAEDFGRSYYRINNLETYKKLNFLNTMHV